MADLSISQLSQSNSISSTDLIAFSQDQGGGSYTNGSKYITGKDFALTMHSGSSSIIYVSKEGNDSIASGCIANPFCTVKEALASINDNSSINRYTIQVAPGVYEEDNPITLKSYVSLNGTKDYTQISTKNASSNLFNAVNYCGLNNFFLDGPNTSGASVSVTEAGAVILSELVVSNANDGLYINNASASVTLRTVIGISFEQQTKHLIHVESGMLEFSNIEVLTGSNVGAIIYADGVTSKVYGNHITAIDLDLDYGLQVVNDAQVVIDSIKTCGTVDNNINYGIYCDNASTTVTTAQIGYADTGYYCNNSSTNTILSGRFSACNDAIHTGDTGTNSLVINGSVIEDSVRYDMIIGNNVSAKINGTIMSDAKLNINQNASIIISSLDDTEDDEGLNIKGELHVGSPEFPTESVFGEGDSYTRDMFVYTYDHGTTTYVDVSIDARTASGSTFTFTGTDVDDAIYIASNLKKEGSYLSHHGIKAQIVSNVASANVHGNILTEYWNGSSWLEVKNMTTDNGNIYYPHANELFYDSGSKQIRYDATIAHDGWTANDPISSGINRYWMRYRIASAAVTSAPVFEQFKLHSNRFEVNGDGFLEYFGSSRPIGVLPWDAGLVEAASASPDNQNTFLSDKLDVGRRENEFADTANDRIGFLSPLPLDCDTSTPIKLGFSYFPFNPGGASTLANVVWVVRWGYLTPDGLIYGDTTGAPSTHSTEQSVSTTVASPAVNTLKWHSVSMDVSNMIARREDGNGDTLFVTIERESSNGSDNTDFHMILVGIQAKYTKWCEGGHILIG